ncbi:hypothetical protein L6164_013479 [Bauhinia variegata]|uniref:Uncharacterized protein n=1 Tax=Bauhinia variegata TaxID=167791 RepID=A0ACB9NEJ6_BAUVA|nr:hypothetical protein L6164_013479 [Bauhinia variegata]
MDLLGSLSESFSSNALALVPATSETATSQANAQAGSNSAATFAVASSASSNVNQPFEDPFGDSPFKAIPSNETAPSNPQIYQSLEPPQSNGLNAATVSNFGFGDSFSGATSSTSIAANSQPFSIDSQFSTQDLSTAQQETDILADILPPAPLPAMTSHEDLAAAAGQPSPHSFPAAQPTSQFIHQGFSAPTGQPAQQAFSVPSGQIVPLSSPAGQPVQQPFSSPTGQPPQQPFSAPSSHSALQPFSPTGQPTQQPFSAHTGQPAHQPFSASAGQPVQQPFSAPTGQPPQQPFS